VARITRKELKSDKFAQEVGLTVTFFEEHQKDVVRYGGIGVAVILLIGGFFIYQRHEHAARQEALAQAIRVQETPVANVAVPTGRQTFPTQDAKDQAAIRAFADLESKYSGSDEAQIADITSAPSIPTRESWPTPRRTFSTWPTTATRTTSLAKIRWPRSTFPTAGRPGREILRDLMAQPTVFVSKDQAAIALAKPPDRAEQRRGAQAARAH
jgi:hypothetical protein